MAPAGSPALPSWVSTGDGRLVAFEPDRIALDLYLAGERLGRQDAFLARELTAGVLHFLAEEATGAVTTADHLRDVVVKVVRGFGHPALARAFAERPPGTPRSYQTRDGNGPHDLQLRSRPLQGIVKEALARVSRERVYTRDVMAAHDEGLIRIHGLEHPGHLAGGVLDLASGSLDFTSPTSRCTLGDLAEAREVAGSFLSVIGVDRPVAGRQGDCDATTVGNLNAVSRLTGLPLVVQLNTAGLPNSLGAGGPGPLFEADGCAERETDRAAVAEGLLGRLLSDWESRLPLWIDWHLGEGDLRAGTGQGARMRLYRLANLASRARSFSFLFDRQRRPIPLGPGLDSQYRLLLLIVGLSLPQFARLPGVGHNPDSLLHKVAVLASLAMSAAKQKRAYLRELRQAEEEAQSPINRRFLLARSRVVVVPLGLDAAVRSSLGEGVCQSHRAAEFGRSLLSHLRASLLAEGKRSNFEVCLGGARAVLGEGEFAGVTVPGDAENDPNLTGRDPGIPPEVQIRTAGSLHGPVAHGAVTVCLPGGQAPEPETIGKLLGIAWKETSLTRLRFRAARGPQQLRLPGL